MSKRSSEFSDAMSAVRRQRWVLFLLGSVANLLMLVSAIYMLQVYDRVLSSGSLDTLLWLTVVALVALGAYGVLEQARRVMLSRAALHIDAELSAPVLRRNMGRLLSEGRFESGIRDVADLRNYYQSDAVIAFHDAPWSFVFIVFIWALHPVLGVVAVAGALVLFAASLANEVLTRRRLGRALADLRSGQEAATRLVAEGETIMPLGMEGPIFDRWQDRHTAAMEARQRVDEITIGIVSLTRAVRPALQVLILGSGAWLVLHGETTPGAMVAASIILGRVLAPVERSLMAWGRFTAKRAAEGRLAAAFEKRADAADPLRLPRPSGRVEASALSYAVPDAPPILRGVSFALAPGSICGVVGESGAGKSTLCRLMVGAVRPTAGHVRLDGADVASWDSDDLGRYIGYLPQMVRLFPGTIAENIARFRKTEDEAVIRAAQLAGAHDLILRLPEGYDTLVTDAGTQLSIGQCQRIGLARALFGDPSFVVLDEPNSNLDAEGDRALIAAIGRLRAMGTTVIVVSHRAGVLRVTDHALVLHAGQAVKFGETATILKPAPMTDGDAPATPVEALAALRKKRRRPPTETAAAAAQVSQAQSRDAYEDDCEVPT
ncbi:type I secretion system permease/ATPase [Albidovulum sediminis]|uniref:Type I secretion system permease/ATPase n=1 Tax=Albidovulum sediminis TaxID=3066345 RepID=A0ABT2NN41_9RHOB|nr:type I secretion system permease/ATPase [Defluviimonas sediminis]MCT8330347.1 type I secretion system permease/ATPase [Defluviimonas sediminis]